MQVHFKLKQDKYNNVQINNKKEWTTVQNTNI